MNLVVTGATSFLGVALIRELLKENHQVYAVVRPGSKNRAALDAVAGGIRGADEVATEIRGADEVTLETCASDAVGAQTGGLTVVELELEQLDQIDQWILEPCQVYFHFGWDGSGSENRKKADVQQKNVHDALKALEGAKKLGCRRFVFSGSQAEYGVCQTVMDEARECHPVSEYGKAKVEFYRLATAAVELWNREQQELEQRNREQQECRLDLLAAESGRQASAEKCQTRIEYIHTRIFSVYGPGDHPWSLVNTCLKRFQNDETMELGACTQQWNFLYIEDLVKGLMALAFCEDTVGYTGDSKENGIYNVAADEDAIMPLRSYVEKMHRLCGNRGRCVYGKVPPNAEGQANLIPDIRKIKEKTGWKPEIDFEEGILRMLNIEKECIICGQPLDGQPLMSLDGMPASAQDIPGADEVEQDTGVTLHLHQCKTCGLVQFDCEPVAYYRDVIRSGGYSTTMVNLRTSQYRHLIDTYHLEGKKFLEVGCGRGEFLKVLTGFPVEAYGVEHRQPLVDIAVADGLNVVHGFTEAPDTVLGENGPYDVFLSFNFLEHQPQPGVMLDCIYRNLVEDGMGLVTVPSLEYILQYDGYYELIRDHIAYYTFDTLRYLLEHHGFEVLEEEMVNRDTLAVIVRKKSLEGNEGDSRCTAVRTADVEACGSVDATQASAVDISGLKASLIDIRAQMDKLTGDLEEKQQSLAIWGASHQGFTLAATTCLGRKASYIIDSAPFKQGRFAPASHLPIVAPDYYPEHPVDVILIVAPGYTEEIAGVIRSRFGAEVKILTLRSERIEEL